jgi:hypothetical protein
MQRHSKNIGNGLVIANDKSDDEDFHENDADMQEMQSVDNMGSNRMSQRLHHRNFTLGK